MVRGMARYSELLGKRIEVYYRAGDIFLPAVGTMAADSGKSIFLEEQYTQQGKVKNFRWEIPYECILRLEESTAPPPPVEAPEAKQGPAEEKAGALEAWKLGQKPTEA